MACSARFERQGTLPDLEQAAAELREAVATAADDDAQRSAYLSNLSTVATQFAVRSGGAEALTEAIVAAREAIATTAVDDPLRASRLATLAWAVMSRFERFGAVADLAEAIDLYREALASTSREQAVRANRLCDLGAAHQTRYKRSDDPQDLHEAVRLCREAVAQTPRGRPDHNRALSLLCSSLRLFFLQSADPADIDDAVAAGEELVATVAADHPDRAVGLSALGNAWHTRYLVSRAPEDLDRAMTAMTDWRSLMPAGHAMEAAMLLNLGLVLQARHHLHGDVADLDRALDAWQQAASSPLGHAVVRAKAASLRGAAAASAQRWPAALDGFAAAVHLLPLVAWRGAGRAGQEYHLTGFSGVPSEAAGCAITVGRTRQAIELIEQGSTILWSQLLDLRTDLDPLRRRAPDLATRLEMCALQAEREPDPTTPPPPLEEATVPVTSSPPRRSPTGAPRPPGPRRGHPRRRGSGPATFGAALGHALLAGLMLREYGIGYNPVAYGMLAGFVAVCLGVVLRLRRSSYASVPAAFLRLLWDGKGAMICAVLIAVTWWRGPFDLLLILVIAALLAATQRCVHAGE